MLTKIKLLLAFLIIATSVSFAQNTNFSNLPVADYSDPKEYTIEDIKVSGVQFLDTKILLSMSGLTVGRKITIPGDESTKIIDKFWAQGLFSDVKLIVDKTEGNKVWLILYLKERPRLSKFVITGVKKSDATDLIEKLKIKPGMQVTDNSNQFIINTVKHQYKEKGYFNTKINLVQTPDTFNKNRILLTAEVTKGEKVRIKHIEFVGNVRYSDKHLRRTLKKTRQLSLNIFKPSKFIEKQYKEDKKKLQDYYSKNGYRDFVLESDSIVPVSPNRINLFIKIHEGKQYHIRNIIWMGNTKYPSEILDKVLILKKGDVYDQVTMEKRLFSDEDAVHNLYLDHGYLFSQVTPVETKIENDSIDIEMHIQEGRQATINRIIITGNTKTNENVVRRELYTRPGDLFSRSDIVSSVRRLAQLGNFDPEKIVPEPLPNQSDGTVDIQYKLVEKANDQLEISGGWGYNSLVGTVGLKFNNFSTTDFFKPKAWRPVPSGDGQSLSLRVQSNGSWMRSISMSFTDPWFGGKKPNSFSFSLQNQVYDYSKNITNIRSSSSSYSDQKFTLFSASIGLGRRLQWPDDNFTLSHDIAFAHYSLRNWKDQWFTFTNGVSNTVSFGTTLSRSTIDQPNYPRSGSLFTVGLQITPPFSAFRAKNFWMLSSSEYGAYANDEERFLAEQARKYKFIEYHKWSYRGMWVTSIYKDLVFSFNSQFGYLGYFNKNLGFSPFEGYVLGGSGMTWNSMGGREIIGLRGYADYTVTPNTILTRYINYSSGLPKPVQTTTQIANIYTKMTMELRYPISLQPQAMIYALIFTEGGNSWYHFEDFNPFGLKRSAGIGIRAFLPMIGSLGVDWGYGFDAIPNNPSANKGQFHFTMGQQF